MQKSSLVFLMLFWTFAVAVPGTAFAFSCKLTGPGPKDILWVDGHPYDDHDHYLAQSRCPHRVVVENSGWVFNLKKTDHLTNPRYVDCHYERKDFTTPVKTLIFKLLCEVDLSATE